MELTANSEKVIELKFEDLYKYFNVYEIHYELYVRREDAASFKGGVSIGYHYEEKHCFEIFEVNWAKIGFFSIEDEAEKQYNDWLQANKEALNSIHYNRLKRGYMEATHLAKPKVIMNVQLVFVGTRSVDGSKVPPIQKEVLRKDYWRD